MHDNAMEKMLGKMEMNRADYDVSAIGEEKW
jgi:hypothetical protein